ncbi:MAG TPA: hypothetical protein DHV85_19940, partial [Candidatus Accumulibacter sp.]|nr:hypothetical protein [Accumulibacter sp.]
LSAGDRALFDAYALLLGSDSLMNGTLERIYAGNWAPGALRATVLEYANIFTEMDDPYLRERAADILEEMSPGSAADALEDLDQDVAEEILANMEPEEAADVQELLAYEEGSAGRIMRTDFVRVRASVTVSDVLALLRAQPDVPDPLLAVYVVAKDAAPVEHPTGLSGDDRAVALRGIVRLRNLVIADPTTPLAEVMDHDTPTVRPEDRAEQAARIMAEYNLLAVPVLDDAERLIGIVTVDDALAELLPEIWHNRGARAFA